MLMAMLLLAAGTPLASAAASPAPTAAVPAEIERHYRDYNFVNAFSTRGERTMIADGRAPSERRLGKVARAMKRLAARVEDTDPGILIGGRGALDETTFRSDLVRIASWRTGGAAGRTPAVTILADLAFDPLIAASNVSFASVLGFTPAACSNSRTAASVREP